MVIRVRRNLKRSSKQMAKKVNVSVRRIIKNNHKLLPLKLRKGKYLTPFQKQKKILDIASIPFRNMNAGTAE